MATSNAQTYSYTEKKRIRKNFGNNVHVSVMSQFNPLFHSSDYPELTRPISQEEFEKMLKLLEQKLKK